MGKNRAGTKTMTKKMRRDCAGGLGMPDGRRLDDGKRLLAAYGLLISGGVAGRYEPGHEKVGRIRWECVEGRPCRPVRKGFMAVSY